MQFRRGCAAPLVCCHWPGTTQICPKGTVCVSGVLHTPSADMVARFTSHVRLVVPDLAALVFSSPHCHERPPQWIQASAADLSLQ